MVSVAIGVVAPGSISTRLCFRFLLPTWFRLERYAWSIIVKYPRQATNEYAHACFTAARVPFCRWRSPWLFTPSYRETPGSRRSGRVWCRCLSCRWGRSPFPLATTSECIRRRRRRRDGSAADPLLDHFAIIFTKLSDGIFKSYVSPEMWHTGLYYRGDRCVNPCHRKQFFFLF